MDIKYRIRRRKTSSGEEFYVDYKRINDGESIDDVQWKGGFYSRSEEEAMETIERHREYEALRLRLQMSEEVIYDETGEE